MKTYILIHVNGHYLRFLHNIVTLHGTISAPDEHAAAKIISSEIMRDVCWAGKDSYMLNGSMYMVNMWLLQEIKPITARPDEMA